MLLVVHTDFMAAETISRGKNIHWENKQLSGILPIFGPTLLEVNKKFQALTLSLLRRFSV